MAGQTTIEAIVALLQTDAPIVDRLPGGIWDRPLLRNVSTDPTRKTPASTPDAFESDGIDGRVKRSAAVIGLPESYDPLGAQGAYLDTLEIWFWCLPHRMDKQHIEGTVLLVRRLLDGRGISTLGAGARLRIAGRIPFMDDPDIGNAVVTRQAIQINGVWR